MFLILVVCVFLWNHFMFRRSAERTRVELQTADVTDILWD